MFAKLKAATDAKFEDSDTKSQASTKSETRLTEAQCVSKLASAHEQMIKKHPWFRTVVDSEENFRQWIGFTLAPEKERKRAQEQGTISKRWARALGEYWPYLQAKQIDRAALRALLGVKGYNFAKAPIMSSRKAKPPESLSPTKAAREASKREKKGAKRSEIDVELLVNQLIICFRRRSRGSDDVKYTNVLEQYEKMEEAAKTAFKTHQKIVAYVRDILQKSDVDNSTKLAKTIRPMDVYGLSCVDTGLYTKLRKKVGEVSEVIDEEALPVDELFAQIERMNALDGSESDEEELFAGGRVRKGVEGSSDEGSDELEDAEEPAEEEEAGADEDSAGGEKSNEGSSWLRWLHK